MGKNSAPKLEFLGAAKTVTGSKTLIRFAGKKILVDCGLFQGPKDIRQRNWEEFEYAKEIDAIFLTHAHIDHSGYLPKIVKEGYEGPIYCSSGTSDLCQIMLPDSAHLQEEDARFANRSKHSRHDPAFPLYRVEDAKKALSQFKTLESNEWTEIFPQISVRLQRAGHILGSTVIQFRFSLDYGSKIITFSGDLGHDRQNVIKGPEPLLETDYLVLEGTYGNRRQSKDDPSKYLAECIHKIHKKSSVLVIPSFAVGRTQEILYLLRKLEVENKIPEVPVYLDSPMAVGATQIYMRHKEDLKLSFEKGELHEPLQPKSFTAVGSADESMLLCMQDGPMVVVSAAGMLTGGRVLHHLKSRLPNPDNIVMFVGYQALETKGRLLKEGLPKIRIHHQTVDVDAEIVALEGLSAHADSEEILHWVSQIDHKPKKIILNHGEEAPLKALQYRLKTELGLESVIAEPKQEYIID